MDIEFRSLYIDRTKCDGMMKCMSICPTEAIRVRKGKALILEDRCIDCGECIKVCPQKAIVPMTDSFTEYGRYEFTAAFPSPVLFSQFSEEISPATILTALKMIGFNEAIDLTPYCEAVSIAIQEYLNEYPKRRPIISSFCPTVIRLIQISYPDLTKFLLPIDSPMEIAAREWRTRIQSEKGIGRDNLGAIYITACPSKLSAIMYHPQKQISFLDGAVSIQSIYSSLLPVIAKSEKKNGANQHNECNAGLGWAILGGQSKFLEAERTVAVGGIHNIITILDDIENEKIKDIDYVECHACIEGCVGGSLTVENPYVARSEILRLLKTYGEKFCHDKNKIKHLYQQGYFLLEGTLPTSPLKPLDNDLSEAIRKLKKKDEIFRGLRKLDCGICGAPTCLAFAEDIVRGTALISDCIFKSIEENQRLIKELYERASSNTALK